MTVSEFWDRWTTDPLWARPKVSTNIHNRERTRGFVARHGSLPLRRVDDAIVGDWLARGNTSTVPALRAMFNDAASGKAGRLVDRNPFSKLGLARSRGNRDVTPPDPDMVAALVRCARTVAGPGLSAWLAVAAATGLRPGELDALRWDCVDFDRGRVLVAEQFNSNAGMFTSPKNGRRRWAPLTPPARSVLLEHPRDPSGFCFVNLRGQHWTASARAYHWKATRAAAGYTGTLYLATRHYAGWYMTNVLGLGAEDVAIALGHTDGGYLVRTLYGHREDELALDRVLDAFADRQNVVALVPRSSHAGAG